MSVASQSSILRYPLQHSNERVPMLDSTYDHWSVEKFILYMKLSGQQTLHIVDLYNKATSLHQNNTN